VTLLLALLKDDLEVMIMVVLITVVLIMVVLIMVR
jgi:hypothetical protein